MNFSRADLKVTQWLMMVNDVMQNGGYIVKNFTSIDMEEKVGGLDDDEFALDC